MLVESTEQGEAVIREVAASREVFIDFEAKVAKRGKGIDPYHRENHISGAAVKVPGGEARYLSFRHPDSFNLPLRVLHDLWRTACQRRLSNHNVGFDAVMAHVHEGLPLPTEGRDSMVAMQLVNENHLGPTGTRKGAYALKWRASRMFGADAITAEAELSDKMRAMGLDPKADLWKLRAVDIAPYACDDVNLVERVFETLDPQLEKLGITGLAEEMYQYRTLLTRMEVDGVWLDRPLIETYLREAERNEATLARVIKRRSGKEPGSNLGMQMWLGLEDTQKWRLKAAVRAGSDDAGVLLEWRRWRDAASKFYRPYLAYSDEEGHLHPSFGFVRTGRLSVWNPNLHATPHYSEPYKCKDVFVAPPCHFLVLADWRAAEARLCAHYTQDPLLMEIFLANRDFHQEVADGLGFDRNTAKTLNFASFYGMGPKKYARQYGVSEKEAKSNLAAYHARYAGPRSLYRRMNAIAEARNWIRLWDGRYRRFNKIGFENRPHSASNSLLQGAVGAMARRAMLALAPWVYSSGGQIQLQIHDAILFCLPVEMDRPETYETIRAAMEGFEFRLPMPVDMKKGKTWGALKPL